MIIKKSHSKSKGTRVVIPAVCALYLKKDEIQHKYYVKYKFFHLQTEILFFI